MAQPVNVRATLAMRATMEGDAYARSEHVGVCLTCVWRVDFVTSAACPAGTTKLDASQPWCTFLLVSCLPKEKGRGKVENYLKK